MFHYKKKEVARSWVRGVEIEFDSLRLASILCVPGNTGICEYMKDVWEYSKYINTLETTWRFANDEMITEARRVKLTEMKSFQSEGPYTMVFEAFDVLLIDKQGEEPKRYDFFEETFLTMCQLKGKNGVWWLGSGENRRRDNEEVALVQTEEVNEEEQNPEFDWEAVIDEAALQGEFGSDDKFYNAEVKVEEPEAEDSAVPVFPASPADSSTVHKEKTTVRVDPSIPSGSIPDSVVLKLQTELEQARARRLQADLEKA
ncbi:hypothetical protein Dimus_020011 [Dionaea muscipula]